MKKCYRKVLLLMLMAITAIVVGKKDVKAATIIDSGSCGDSATYTLDDDGVLTISGSGEVSSEAFYGWTIESVLINDGITSIGYSAFMNCEGLKCVMISESVTSIGQGAFCGCISLTNINIPENITCIETGLFCECRNLINVTISENINCISVCAFENCTSLTSFIIPQNVNEIESYAFRGCINLKNISIAKGLKCIGNRAFEGCDSLKMIEIYEKDVIIYEQQGGCTIPSSTTIYGYKNSTAQTYAEEHGNKFVELTETNTKIKLTTKNTTIKLSKKSYTYDGKAKKPTVKVLNSKGKVLKKDYYSVKYSNNVKVGKAIVTIKFKGKYTGTIKATYTIKPKATKFTGASKKSTSVTLTWKKQTKQVTGYQIQYATDSKFTKNKQTIVVVGAKKSSETITGLSKKTKYYFRIRTYKTVNGKKYYSAWSKGQAVTTK